MYTIWICKKKNFRTKILLKKAQTHKKTNFCKHPMLRFYKKHILASKLFLFSKEIQVDFFLNLCSRNQSVIAGVCINSLSAKSVLAGEKLIAMYSIST
jgi:hypothetical protein